MGINKTSFMRLP